MRLDASGRPGLVSERQAALYSYNPDNGGSDFVEIIGSTSKPVALGEQTWLKVRAESAPGGTFYSMKIWPNGSPEPAGWDVTGQAHPDTLENGSLLLLSHMADASFGAVQVTPLAAGPDTVPPAIALAGNNPLALAIGDQYVEPGWTATDNVDGDLTDQVTVSGSVDSSTEGRYTLTYSVTDSAGNTGNATRRVDVVSATDTTPPVITLNGANPYTLSVGVPYSEPGWTAIDDVDGDLSGLVAVSGSVETNVPGSYTLIYAVTDSAGNTASTTRTVNVIAEPDTTPPVITLDGADPYTLTVGIDYSEPGWTATDNRDGDLSDRVTVSGSVNTNVPGTYPLAYSVADSSGNAASATRTVNVVLDTTPPVIALKGDNPLILIQGERYIEPGWSAEDNIDDDLSDRVNVSGAVNAGTVGLYTLTYAVTDSSGNSVSVTRTVDVVPNVRIFLPTIRR